MFLRMLSKIYRRLEQFCYNLNLFRNPGVINNCYRIRNQYISTRIFILSFGIILGMCFVYLLLTRITTTITIEAPTELSFKKLNKNFHNTLQCPCTNLSIPLRTFIALRATFHPICSVNLEPIITSLFKYTESLSNNHDFRFTGALQFRLLTLLCSSVDEIITSHLIDFNETLFENIFLVEESNLRDQVQDLIEQFIQIVTDYFIHSLKMIRINNFGSQVRLNSTLSFSICIH